MSAGSRYFSTCFRIFGNRKSAINIKRRPGRTSAINNVEFSRKSINILPREDGVVHVPNVYTGIPLTREIWKSIMIYATMISGRFGKEISYRYFCPKWNSEFFNPPVYAKIVRQINFISLRFLFPLFQKYSRSLKLKKKKNMRNAGNKMSRKE